MRKISLALALITSIFALPAHADFTAKDASAATITFKNPGICTSVVCVPVFQLYDGTNVVTLTTAGADGVSNTLTGLPAYSRMLSFNGTTWDRWQGAVKIASGGAAAGALAAGAGVDGWDLTQGAKADTICATATGTCSVVALLKYLNTAATSAIPAGTAIIGQFGIDQTTQGTTNGVVAKASEAHVGEIGSNQIKVQVAQTVTASSAYASGNAIGSKMTIAGAARVSGSLGAAGTGGILTGLMVNSKSLQTTQVDVFLFDADPSGSTCTDKTAFSLATADFDKVIGVVTIPGTAANGAGWYAGTVGSAGVAAYYPVTYDLASATSIYACAVTRGTPTYTATTDVSFKFNILRN